MGCGIRRLVSLFESLDTIINKADNHLQAEVDSRVPLRSTTDDSCVYMPQLQRGANDAHSDDVRHIKEEVANWINQTYSPATPLSLKQRCHAQVCFLNKIGVRYSK